MRLLVLMVAALSLVACEKKNDGASGEAAAEKPKGPAPAPIQKARIVPKKGAAGAPVAAPVAAPGSQPVAAPSSQPTGKMPTGHPAVPGAPQQIGGTIELSKDLAGDIKPGAVLFIIVRRDAGEGSKGMLIAAKKFPAKADMFPLKYTVTSKDVMMQGTALTGSVRVEARIDFDGDAISKNAGDIIGKAAGAHAVGTDGVNFKLDGKI